jgi:hypothetical protein
MEKHREFQFATIVFIISFPIQILLTFLYSTNAGTHPMSLPSFIMVNGLFLVIYLLFYGMKTTVNRDRIQISYGIGLIRKSIKLSRIKGVHIVSNPWYYGWGIRLIPNGWLYNINGSAGVELRFKDTSRAIRIGSADSAHLQRAISSMIKEELRET